MFAEKPIYGQCIIHSDVKGRTILPAFTGVESTDELLVMRDIEGIRISLVKEVDEYVAYLEEKCKQELDPQKNELLRNRLLSIYSRILKCCSCDKQRRVLLSDILKPNKEYLVVGCRTSVIIRENTADSQKKLHVKRSIEPSV